MNPLALLHRELSEGIHEKSDQECLKAAVDLREILEFLVTQIKTTAESSKKFTESMRKRLDEKVSKKT